MKYFDNNYLLSFKYTLFLCGNNNVHLFLKCSKIYQLHILAFKDTQLLIIDIKPQDFYFFPLVIHCFKI